MSRRTISRIYFFIDFYSIDFFPIECFPVDKFSNRIFFVELVSVETLFGRKYF